MGMIVTRQDPATGEDRDYYKGDDGKLYNDYSHAVTERNKGGYDKGVIGTARHLIGKAYAGLDGALGNNLTAPSIMNAGRLVRDMAKEGLPGNQVTSLDNPLLGGEASIKKANSIKEGDLLGAGLQNNTGRQVGKGREKLSEHGFRAAGRELIRRFPGVAARFTGGTAATGGAGAVPLALWGAYDLTDTASQIATGKPINHHVNEGWGNSVVQPDDTLRLPPMPF